MMQKKHNFSRFTLFLSLVMRFVPAIFIGYNGYTSQWDSPSTINIEQIISDGLFLSILSSDLVIGIK